MYQPKCLELAMETLLGSIEHGVFWFNGFGVLPAFIASKKAHLLAHMQSPGDGRR